MGRAVAFALVQALFMLPVTSSGCLAADQSAPQQAAPQQTVPQPPARKPSPKTRSFRMDDYSAPPAGRVPGAPVPSIQRGDGGSPDETVGGLPGHSGAAPAKQP